MSFYQFYESFCVEQQILGFEIPVDDVLGV